MLLAVGLEALHLIHKSVADLATAGAARLHLDTDNRHIERALSALLEVDDRKLRAIGAGALSYAALLLTEGAGLLLRKRWAEYFTVIVTGSFIPLELYELVRRLTVTRFIVLAVNVAIVWYLIGVLWRDRGHGP